MRRLALAALLLLAAGACAPFEEPFAVGRIDGVVGRPDGPAAALVSTRDGTWTTWAEVDAGGTDIACVRLADDRAPVRLTTESDRRRHPPRAFADPEGGVTIAWRENSETDGGRIVVRSRRPDRLFLPAREIPAKVGSDVRGGGAPLVLMAVEGAAPTPRNASATRLSAWQRLPGTTGWAEVAPPTRGRPWGFAAHGVGGGRLVTATIESAGELTLTRWRDDAPPRRTALDARPVGPNPPWLASAGRTLLAGWSQWTPGRGAPAVRIARSTDGGATWTPPRAVWSAPDGTAPMAHFATDGVTVAAAWLTGEGKRTRVAVAVSTDAGETFAAVPDVARGSATRRARPRVAVAGPHVLVAWQERDGGGRTRIRASASRDRGRTLHLRDEAVADAPRDRRLRNPQPWIHASGAGGVVWESLAPPPRARPSVATEPERVTLHVRRLRR